MHGRRIHLYSACIYKGERRMPCTGKKDAPTFSFCVIKCVDFWLCHVNMKEKVRKRPCLPQEASQTARFLSFRFSCAARSRRLCQPP